MKTVHIVAAAAAMFFSAAAAAQSMKPGLWEVTQSMKSSNPETQNAMAQMQQQMAAMSPEQKKMVQDMMAKQGMQSAGGAPGGGQTIRTCVTREQAERNEVAPQRDGCKMTQQTRSGNTLKFAYTCVSPPSSGEGEYTFTSSEAYKMRMVVNTTMKGRQETMNMDGSGKWLSADCGDVKPPMRPPGK